MRLTGPIALPLVGPEVTDAIVGEDSRGIGPMRTMFVGLLLLVVASVSCGGDNSAGPGAEYPDDLLALGLEIADASPEGKISKDAAINVAFEVHGQEFGAEVDAYLVNLTDDSSFIQNRDVWIVRFSGFELPITGPIAPGESQGADGGSVRYAYVYVDAATGEWILTRAEG